jgi:hypothetical protein
LRTDDVRRFGRDWPVTIFPVASILRCPCPSSIEIQRKYRNRRCAYLEIATAEVLCKFREFAGRNGSTKLNEYLTVTCTTQPGLFTPFVVPHADPAGVVPGQVDVTLRFEAVNPSGVMLITILVTSPAVASQLKLLGVAQLVPCHEDPRTIA